MMEILCPLLALLIIPSLFVLTVYNGLIGDRNMANNAFSTIDVMLKKRWDLIPNLVSTAKGYLQHESDVLQRVSQLRSAAMTANTDPQRFSAESELTGALGQLRVVIEKYPDLKAHEHMLYLQRSLTECEEQIAAARRAFNAAILQYNNRVEMFPHNLVAQWFGFQRRDFFEIQVAERQAPQVSGLN